MTGTALDEFASASRALRRLAEHVRASEPKAIEAEARDLHTRFPDAFSDLQEPFAGTREDRLDAVISVGTRIAERLTADLARYARAHYRQNRFPDAVRVFALTLVIDPGSAAAMVMYASALELSHPRANFRAPARRATILAPLGPDGWKLAMRGSLAAAQLDAARGQARHHLLLAPGSRDGWFILARACFRGGRPEDAHPMLRRARTVAPMDLDIQLAMTRCLFRLGRFSEALVAIEGAGALGASGPDHAFEHARIARSAGRMDIATPVLDQLVTDQPTYRDKREILELTATTTDLRGQAR